MLEYKIVSINKLVEVKKQNKTKQKTASNHNTDSIQ
jgi:hypothetical protein